MPTRSFRGRKSGVRSGAPGPSVPASGGQPDVASLLDPFEQSVIDQVRPYTMVSAERLIAIMDAVRYIASRDLPGAFVECGVWRGGSILTMIKTLQHLGINDRDIYLYDTFEGMTRPSEADTSRFDAPALDTWEDTQSGDRPWDWAFAPEIYGLDFVKKVVIDSGYPEDRLHFVVGPVEDTMPGTLPDTAALVRLDTDWYESTLHELIHLYPNMPTGGVLIIDDFGHWDGARRAVEEYFSTHAQPILLTRSDYTGRMGIKQ